ncbi:MAG: hypothetical protein HON14_09190, partial [Rhodospirillaceae bacterium]|nr:hypothetical protein [Rhodospirillaceae bacterium]
MFQLTKPNLILIAGLTVFFIAKSFFIVGQTSTMGMARLGDDAYVHMWRAEQINDVGFFGAVSGDIAPTSTGVLDIARYCGDAEGTNSEKARRYCARLADNTAVPDVKVGASLLLNLILKSDLPLKWSYAVYEMLIAAVIAAGFAYFLVRLYGFAAAGVSLMFFAFLNFMIPQGLHQFIPSTLALGISCALLGTVVGTDKWQRFALAAAGFAILSFVHPLSIVMGAALVPLALLSCWQHYDRKIMFGVLAGAGVGFLLLLAVNSVVRGIVLDLLSVDSFTNFMENLSALPNRLYGFLMSNLALVPALIVSLYWAPRLVSKSILHVAMALLFVLAATFFYKTEFFIFSIPLDLFARIFVVFSVLCFGYLAKVIIQIGWQGSIWRKAGVSVLIGVLCVPSAVRWMDSFYYNINLRPQVIDEKQLTSFIAGRDKNTTIAYGELNITPNVAFIAGADQMGAIPMDGLTPKKLQQLFAEQKPDLLALPNFQMLNMLSDIKSRSMVRRRHGLPAIAIDSFAVTPGGGSINSIYLRVENPGPNSASIGPMSYATSTGKMHDIPNLQVDTGEPKWIKVSTGSEARTAIFEMQPSALWVTGISVNAPPRPGVNWP